MNKTRLSHARQNKAEQGHNRGVGIKRHMGHQQKIRVKGCLPLLVLALFLMLPTAQPLWANDTLEEFDISAYMIGGDFQLTGHHGKPVKLSDLNGEVVMLSFGYTFCPDVCPTTLLEMANARKKLGEKGEKVRGVFISVDPERDTPKRLAEYIGFFDPSFLGLTGSLEKLEETADLFHARFQRKTEKGTQASYLVMHTSHMFLIDRKGRARFVIPFGSPQALLLSGLNKLLGE